MHLVNAWATANHLTLGGQVAVADKFNEIAAIPKLLELLDLKGSLVIIDGMGCQKEIAQAIVEGGSDYVLTVNDNQPTLRADILLELPNAIRQILANDVHSPSLASKPKPFSCASLADFLGTTH
ncbi:ISAs1 family transposase [bacterium]|nr:ISAs1 family transposase [bacterium]